MSRALLNVPACLDINSCYVGEPSQVRPPESGLAQSLGDAFGTPGTAAYRRLAVQECLDTASVLRSYREPLRGETWLTPLKSERRLLAQVNAILALGEPALKQVMEHALDPDVPDPSRVFAALFVLGCVEGSAWLTPLRDIFTAAALRTQAEMAAAVEALSLSPNPGLGLCLEPLLTYDKRQIRASVVRILSFRGALAEGAWEQAMNDPDPGVMAAACQAPLRGYSRERCENALRRHLGLGSEMLTRPALRAGVSLRSSMAYQYAVEIALRDPSWADSLHFMAMFGFLSDEKHIAAVLEGPYPAAGIQAAATLGCIKLVPHLIALFERSGNQPEILLQARRALRTITGLVFDDVQDGTQARRMWTQNSSALDIRVRYRIGQPLSVALLRDLLHAGPLSREDRQNIYLELLAATECRAPRFSAYDFVGVQMEALHKIDEWLDSRTAKSSRGRVTH